MAGARPLRILMLTTSYPPAAGVPNGAFVHRLAARLVAAGHEVDVLAPHAEGAQSRVEDGVRSHFFRYAPSRLELLAYGPGMVYNLSVDRRRLALLPSFGAAFAVAAARHARRADVVHGHWLPAGMVARVTRRPFVTTVHGSDLALAERVPGTGARDALQPRHDRRQRGHAPRAREAGAARRHPRRAAGRRRVPGPALQRGDARPAAVRRPPGRREGRRHADVGLAGDPGGRTRTRRSTSSASARWPSSSTATACGCSGASGRTRSPACTPTRRPWSCRHGATRSRSPAWRHGDGPAGRLHAGGRHGRPRARRRRRPRRAARRPGRA